MLNGGFTFDGITQLKETDGDIFTIVLYDQTELPEKYLLGLADLGDGDNYLDFCLKLDSDD